MLDFGAIDNTLAGLGLDPDELQRRLFGQRRSVPAIGLPPGHQGRPMDEGGDFERPMDEGGGFGSPAWHAMTGISMPAGMEDIRRRLGGRAIQPLPVPQQAATGTLSTPRATTPAPAANPIEGLPLPQPRGQNLATLATPPAATATRRVEPLPAPAAPAASAAPPMGTLGPRAAALTALEAKGRPELHGWKKGLDIAGQIAFPTIEAAIPGTPGYYDRQLGRAEQAAEREGKLGEQQARLDQTKAQTRNIESEIRKRDQPPQDKPDTLTAQEAQAVEEQVAKGASRIDAIAKVKGAGKREPEPNALEETRRNLLGAMQKGDKQGIATYGKQLETLSDPSGEKAEMRKLTMELARQRVAEKVAKDTALGPHAQQIIVDTMPTLQQVDQLLTALEPMKGDNSSRLTMARIKYAFGSASPEGTLADDISKLELDRVVAGARILKGSSRAYQALELAMKHAPNSWVDTPALMHSKLKNIRQNLADVIEDAKKFGTTKLGSTVKTGTEAQGGKVAGERAAGAGGASTAGRDVGPAPTGKTEGATGTLPDGTKVIVRSGRLIAQ